MQRGWKESAALATLLAAFAVPTWAANCSVVQGDATNAVLNTTNVSLNGSFADDCAGHYDTGDSSLSGTVSFANGIPLFGFSDWSGAAKYDTVSETRTLSGLKFELINVVGVGATSGSFTLKVTDTNGSAPANLPATLDIAVMLSRGANVNDFYFFNDESVGASNNGLFTVGFSNSNNRLQDLSHIDILVRDIRNGELCVPGAPGCIPLPTPEPASLALVGLALAGAWEARRRRRA